MKNNDIFEMNRVSWPRLSSRHRFAPMLLLLCVGKIPETRNL